MSKTLPVVKLLPDVPGSPGFETARTGILESLSAKVPQELRIAQPIIDNPPRNVTPVPRESGILSQEELEITEAYDVVSLAEAVATKRHTAVAVATAFAKRAIIAHQLTCCLSEWFMDEAVEQARALDEYLNSTGKTVGPLHGVPIAVKEMIPLAGHYSSLGFLVTRHKDREDSQMVAILREAGAVFYCKTLQPQGILHMETVSILGRTLNPHNINLSAGGSTGGGAALVAMRGCLLALGTDIGGSIRGPASFCGLYGFKPTSYFLPMRGFTGDGGIAAELNVLGSAGPLGVSLRDMDLFVHVLKAAQPHLEDPRIVPIPWLGLQGSPKKMLLKVGFMMHDGLVVPQPPVIRALNWARRQLSKAPEFEVKDFAPYNAAEAARNIKLAFFPDGGKLFKKALEATGEPALPLTQLVIKEAEAAGQDLHVAGVLEQRVARDRFRCDFARHWAEQDVDVIVCPAYVGPACAHETSFFSNYESFWNYVDCPGVVVPTPIRVPGRGVETYAPADGISLSEDCGRVRQLWEDGDFEGAPINLQIVARKYHDNELFAALKSFQGPLAI